MICRLYVHFCRRVLPGGWTFSARAHMRAQAGKPWLRDFLDAALSRKEADHCNAQFKRDTRALKDAKGPRT